MTEVGSVRSALCQPGEASDEARQEVTVDADGLITLPLHPADLIAGVLRSATDTHSLQQTIDRAHAMTARRVAHGKYRSSRSMDEIYVHAIKQRLRRRRLAGLDITPELEALDEHGVLRGGALTLEDVRSLFGAEEAERVANARQPLIDELERVHRKRRQHG